MSPVFPQLLPSGLVDLLPTQAAAELKLVHQLMDVFMAFGYQPVVPPLAEYASSLLAGQGEATSHHVFKAADPLAPQMLAIRADMTGQVARIATTALADIPRPLRLCYAGSTMRTAPEALKTRRQHTQVGIERFGDMRPQSVAEILAIAAHALDQSGVGAITIDLHFPAIFAALTVDCSPAEAQQLREAVKLKDVARLRVLNAEILAQIIEASGEAHAVLAKLSALHHAEVDTAIAALSQVMEALQLQQVAARFTIDMLDLSGYGYYSGVAYALFCNRTHLEIGRGGSYVAANGEKAVGFTLYINDVLDQLPAAASAPVQTIPYGTPAVMAAKLHAQGIVTVFDANDAPIVL